MSNNKMFLQNMRQFGETDADAPELSVDQLKKNFASLSDAIDAAPSELGAGHYKKAKQKTLTIRHLKRKKLPDLLAVFEKGAKLEDDEPQQEQQQPSSAATGKGSSRGPEGEPTAGSPAATEADIAAVMVKSDKDVAELTIDVIHESFYNPKTGLWPTYDKEFDRDSYLKHAQEGWDAAEDTPARLQAREEVNRLKNLETTKLMEGQFVADAIEIVYQTMLAVVTGVKQKDVKHAIRNHIRDHLDKLVFQ